MAALASGSMPYMRTNHGGPPLNKPKKLTKRRWERKVAKQTKRNLEQRRAWAAAPPQAGYPKGRLAKENFFRRLRGQQPHVVYGYAP